MPDPDPHEVHAWYRSTAGCDDHAVATAWTVLSPDEKARADRFHFAEDRRDYVLAHDLLRRSLSRYADVAPADWVFDRAEGGKPLLRLSQPPAASRRPFVFSLAHTRGFVACALAGTGTIGVDVERLDRAMPIDTVGRWLLAPAEATALAALSPDLRQQRLFELWTLKEAFVKATGEGLSQVVRDIVYEFTDDGRLVVSPPAAARNRAWHAALYLPEADVRLAVALGSAGAVPWHLDVRPDAGPDPVLRPVFHTLT